VSAQEGDTSLTDPVANEAETESPASAAAASIEKARLIIRAAEDLKAEDIVGLDMSALSSCSDVFVILSGRSDRHVRSIAEAISFALRQTGDQPLGVEGLDEGHWVLIDANDVVVHAFDPETRERYDLERLWSDAPLLELGSAEASAD
jgi:ribosome-associated protein